jgi:hypothetical protein
LLQRAPHADRAFGAPFRFLHVALRCVQRVAQTLDLALCLHDLRPCSFLVGSGLPQANCVDRVLIERHRVCLPPNGTATGDPAEAD